MSWLQKLYESYDNCVAASEHSLYKILPICHSMQNAHIEITIDGDGNFKDAAIVNKEKTIMPATEDSAARANGCYPHPLADKIQYCAKDYDDYGGAKSSYFSYIDKKIKEDIGYFAQLKKWCTSNFRNDKAIAVLKYVEKGTLVKDLIDKKLLYCKQRIKKVIDNVYFKNKIEESKKAKNNKYKKYEKIQSKIKDKYKILKLIDDYGDALIRWRVNVKGDLQPETWNDEGVRKSWIDFISNQETLNGLCYVHSDIGETPLAQKHPKNIYSGSSGAKIISANDTSGFTFRGRFEESDEAVGISFDVSQKAHAVLKFLLSNELNMAYQNGAQVYVAWAQSIKEIPKFYDDSYDLFGEGEKNNSEATGNIAQVFSDKLKKKLHGYSQTLGNADNIIIIGLDSATPGRISVIYYKELKGSDFLDRIEKWHKKYSWLQYYNKDKQFYGAASPRDIAKAAYGNQADDKIIKKTVDRLLPLIIENKDIPNDIVESCIRQASNPITLEYWQWQKTLGIACGLYKGNNKKEDYEMSLEKGNSDRNYLYGRLLAIIDYAEQIALFVAKENRETNARKYMTEFRNKPYTTWERLHSMFNSGARHRLKANRALFLKNVEDELEEIHSKFNTIDYKDNSKLNGDYLLAYYCQLADLKNKDDEKDENNSDTQKGE
ncbi:type I-C CRISPR-associated protein Cas8c/Csd1 [Endomicrobium proavitum]|uniref:CRISPR-associated Csd1 family protein n=1 Tax=Endomicrobium proavitum TaxID=1408281 RepID=A0A0G3WLY3_9BACT|nr:type I-C CRISPR-associated protein Cas8c/Csd1 [Endomicrobium proavitum]AKL98464.1 CRISPR-associated Csd1 family protein [Endomicrobium proavitum]